MRELSLSSLSREDFEEKTGDEFLDSEALRTETPVSPLARERRSSRGRSNLNSFKKPRNLAPLLAILQAADSEEISQAHTNHSDHKATMDTGLEYLESLVGDTAANHAKELEGAVGRSQHLHAAVQACAQKEHHASMEEPLTSQTAVAWKNSSIADSDMVVAPAAPPAHVKRPSHFRGARFRNSTSASSTESLEEM